MNEQERAWRQEFPITQALVYLNNCSLTPLLQVLSAASSRTVERQSQKFLSDCSGCG